MAYRNGSGQASCDVNGLIEFWSNTATPDYTFEKNLNVSNESIECYSTADARQIPTIVLRLEKLSSMSIAIALWHHATGSIAELEPDKVECRYSLYKQVREWISQLKLPGLLAKHLHGHFIDLVLQVRDWTDSTLCEIFRTANRYNISPLRLDERRPILHHCLLRLCWHSNGTINHDKTARNLLKSNELSDEKKYRLACKYCLKEEIVNLWKTLVGNSFLNIDLSFGESGYSLICYWNRYCAGRLLYLPLPADEFMIRLSNADNWPVIEYFFDRIDPEKQIAAAIHFIDSCKVEIQDLILAKMNETQRLNLYANKGAQIIVNYLHRGGADINEPNAFSIWYKIRDWITDDQFVSLLKGLCEARVKNDFLMEIWTSANQESKRHILNLDNYDFLGEVLRWGRKKYQSGLEFLFIVLKARSAYKSSIEWTNERKFHFQRLCEKLTFRGEFELANRLLDNFVPDADSCAKIIRILAKKFFSGNHCKSLIVERKFQKLKEFLNFFNPANIAESKEIANNFWLGNFIILMIEDDFPKFKDRFRFEANAPNGVFSQRFPREMQIARMIMFSNKSMLKLHNLIRDETFHNDIVSRKISPFLNSKRSKRRFRGKLISFLKPEELRADPEAKENYLKALIACGL